ncbi:MAG: IS66 family transposase [Butyrivibrio sp.]|uniref:IS66 family transposase n=1 Tax=Butyrivibrio sp. TaxID=28121 RepID=UPI001B4DA562|nr:IS66 family transposase [Butyrivibrio sp.]MBP3782488.1 IS66 family transposase [Butyrivibrio sp.]
MAMIYTEEQLNTIDKSLIIQLFLAEQELVQKLSAQVEEQNTQLAQMDEKMQRILEQVVLSNKARFGRSSEKMDDPNQLCFAEVDGNIILFNEAEAIADLEAPEEDEPKVRSRGKKQVGKKDLDLKGIPEIRVDHYMTDEELTAEFGEKGWKQLPDAISKRYAFTPAKVEVEVHHIGVYAGKKDETHMVKAKHPKALLRGSLVSPTLAAAIMNGKYVNAAPLARIEREMERYGLPITRQQMANWMIRLGEDYIAVMYDYLHQLLYEYHVIQADETPVLVNRDGRPAGSKSWMWVYRSGYMQTDHQIVLYEFQKTRNTSHPREFLRNYQGICVTDGYQVYHTLDKELRDLTIAGCWVHCRRRFSEAQEVLPKNARKGTVSYLVMKQIQAIYREEGKLKDLTSEDRLTQRQVVIKPLVDALFVYLKQHESEVSKSTKLGEAFTYALNQEPYLRVFLTDGEVPIDNNASERAIRGFCIGKKNWQVIDTINGAKTSAMIYSIAETAKANNLKPYEYFRYLLEVIPEHMEDTNRDFLEDLLPWSPKLPESIRKPLK